MEAEGARANRAGREVARTRVDALVAGLAAGRVKGGIREEGRNEKKE